MSDSRKDFTTIDDRTLNAVQAAKLWRLAPESLRHQFMNTLYRVDERLHDEVLRLCDAAPSGTPRRAGGASSTRPASTGE